MMFNMYLTEKVQVLGKTCWYSLALMCRVCSHPFNISWSETPHNKATGSSRLTIMEPSTNHMLWQSLRHPMIALINPIPALSIGHQMNQEVFPWWGRCWDTYCRPSLHCSTSPSLIWKRVLPEYSPTPKKPMLCFPSNWVHTLLIVCHTYHVYFL